MRGKSSTSDDATIVAAIDSHPTSSSCVIHMRRPRNSVADVDSKRIHNRHKISTSQSISCQCMEPILPTSTSQSILVTQISDYDAILVAQSRYVPRSVSRDILSACVCIRVVLASSLLLPLDRVSCNLHNMHQHCISVTHCIIA